MIVQSSLSLCLYYRWQHNVIILYWRARQQGENMIFSYIETELSMKTVRREYERKMLMDHIHREQ